MSKRFCVLTGAVLTLAAVSISDAAPIIRSVGGDDTAASIQAAVDQFRTDLGAPNNGNAPGPLPGGRREINWDGGGAAAPVAVFPSPMTTFNTPPPTRGAVFTTPGSGFTISGQPDPEFGNINPTYPDAFGVFSAPRLFAVLDSNILDVHFFVPGTDTPARVSGFGSIFTDVDLPNTTSLQFFGVNNASLGTFFVEPGTVENQSLSFLGVSFTEGAIVSRVRMTLGNMALGPNDAPGVDVVAMDDFLYNEPQRVPEPATALLVGLAIAGLALVPRKRVVRDARTGAQR